ncbi:MAG: hypothetical protein K0S74_7 [Chlamydiales bacterium]|jgi:hypothetical protein|nr:hypothetical protein [Chlamydiales bacterium]
MLSKKKNGILLFIGVLSIWCLLSYTAWLTAISEWQTQALCRYYFGVPLTYKSFVWEKNSIIIQQPSLKLNESLIQSKLNDTYSCLQAEKLSLSFKVDWRRAHLYFDLNVLKPEAYYDELLLSAQFFKATENTTNYNWFTIDYKIEQGLIYPLTTNLDFNPPIPLSCATFEYDSKLGNGQLQIHSKNNFLDHTNSINMRWLKESINGPIPHSNQFVFEFNKVDIVELKQFFPKTTGKAGDNTKYAFSCSRGFLDGLLSFSHVDKKEEPLLVGNLNLLDFRMEYPAIGLEVELPLSEISVYHHPHKDLGAVKKLSPLWQKIASQTFLQAKIQKPGAVTLVKEGFVNWHMHQLLGECFLEPWYVPRFMLSGFLDKIDEDTPFKAEGSLIIGQKSNYFDLSIALAPEKRENASIHLLVDNYAADKSIIEMELSNISPQEVGTAQGVIGNIFPDVDHLLVEKGSIDISLRAELIFDKLQSVQIVNLTGRNLQATYMPLNLKIGIDKINGVGAISAVKDNLLSIMEGAFQIDGGTVQYLEPSYRWWNVHNIEASLFLDKGLIQQANLEAVCNGLQISTTWQRQDSKDLDTFICLKGQMLGLLNLLPLPVRSSNAIIQAFTDSDICIETTIGFKPNSKLYVKGDLQVQDSINKDDIPFECLLDIDFTGKELSIQDCQGSFSAQKIAIEKYIAPFIFIEADSKLTGKCDVQGVIEASLLTFRYCPTDLVLDTPYLKIENNYDHKEKPIWSNYYVDLSKEKHWGSVPVSGARYQNRQFGWYFESISGNLEIENEILSFKHLKATSEGLAIDADLFIDLTMDDSIDISLNAHSIGGKLSNLQKFLAYLGKSKVWDIPIEGKLNLKQEPLSIHATLYPDQPERNQWVIHAEGKAEQIRTLSSYKAGIERGELSFSYDYPLDTLKIADCEGEYFNNSLCKKHKYNWKIPYLTVECLTDKLCATFDFAMSEGLASKAHLKGSIIKADQTKGNLSEYSLYLDEDSKLADNFYFGIKEMRFNEEGLPTHISAFPTFSLKALAEDLPLILPFAWLEDLNPLFNRIQELGQYKGIISSHIELSDPLRQIYHFTAESEEIALGNYSCENFKIDSAFSSKHWVINQLIWNHTESSLDAYQLKKGVLGINSLRCNSKDQLYVDLQGQYDYLNQSAQFSVRDASIDIEILAQKFAAHLNQVNSYQGKLKGKGVLELDCFNEDFVPQKINGQLSIETTDLIINNTKINTPQPIQLSIDSEEELVSITKALFHLDFIEDSEKTIKSSKPSEELSSFMGPDVVLDFDKITYRAYKRTWNLEKGQFQIATKAPTKIAERLGYYFNTEFKSKFILDNSCFKNPITGSLDITGRNNEYKWQLKVAPNTYFLSGKDLQLDAINIKYTPFEGLQVQTAIPLNSKNNLVASFQSNDSTIKAGTLKLATSNTFEWPVQPNADKSNVILYWERDNKYGLLVPCIVGEIAGWKVDLTAYELEEGETLEFLPFKGSLYCSLAEFYPYLPTMVKPIFKQSSSNSYYEFKGDFKLSKNNISQSVFKGSLEGKDNKIYNTPIDLASAKIEYVSKKMKISHLKLKTGDASLKADSVLLKVNNKQLWKLEIPQILIHNVRPKNLTAVEGKKINSSFEISYGELNSLKGIIGEANTFAGEGYINFENKPKNHWLKPFFAIPSEMVAQMGISPELLIPVKGSLHYKIQSNRMDLTNLSNCYSQSKKSQFFLAQEYMPSSVGFDGKLNIAVKVKQRVMFKFGELFIFYIRGDLNHPSYQVRSLKKETRAKMYEADP